METILRVYTSITTIEKEKISTALLMVLSPPKISGAANRAAGSSIKYAVDSGSEVVTMRSRPATHARPVASMKMFD